MIDLEAMRARNAERARSLVRTSPTFESGAYGQRHDAIIDIDALLAEVIQFQVCADGELHSCMICGTMCVEEDGPHTVRQCRDRMIENAVASASQLHTQTVAHSVWQERCHKRTKERDEARAEVERLQARVASLTAAYETPHRPHACQCGHTAYDHDSAFVCLACAKSADAENLRRNA